MPKKAPLNSTDVSGASNVSNGSNGSNVSSALNASDVFRQVVQEVSAGSSSNAFDSNASVFHVSDIWKQIFREALEQHLEEQSLSTFQLIVVSFSLIASLFWVFSIFLTCYRVI